MKKKDLIRLLENFKDNDNILISDNNGDFREVIDSDFYKEESSSYRNYKLNTLKNGTTEYSCWTAIITRCENKKHKSYKDYGERGIKICQSWRADFMNFFYDMGNRPSKEYSLERIDNDGNYCPNNCRWATKVEQSRNTRACLHIKAEALNTTKGHVLEIGF